MLRPKGNQISVYSSYTTVRKATKAWIASYGALDSQTLFVGFNLN